MNPLLLGPVLEIGRTLIGRLFPDKEAARKAEADFLQLAMEGELKQVVAQLEVNAREAAHPSIFVAGWRPFAGWTCGVALAYHFILQPLLAFLFVNLGESVVLPAFEMDTLMTVLLGMLGIGGMRTWEKAKGVAAK